MRLEDPAAGTADVALTEAEEGHVFSLSLSYSQKSICPGTIVTLFTARNCCFSSHVLGHTCMRTDQVFLTWGRKGGKSYRSMG